MELVGCDAPCDDSERDIVMYVPMDEERARSVAGAFPSSLKAVAAMSFSKIIALKVPGCQTLRDAGAGWGFGDSQQERYAIYVQRGVAVYDDSGQMLVGSGIFTKR